MPHTPSLFYWPLLTPFLAQRCISGRSSSTFPVFEMPKLACTCMFFKCWSTAWGCTVVWWLAPSPHSERVPGSTPGLGPFCVEFACSPRVCVGSLRVLRLPPTVQKKNMHVRLIGVSKIVLRSECERAWFFVSFEMLRPPD